jgi:hypothetical protein
MSNLLEGKIGSAVGIVFLISVLAVVWYVTAPIRKANEKASEAAQAQYEAAKNFCFKHSRNADSYEDCIQAYVDEHAVDPEYHVEP